MTTDGTIKLSWTRLRTHAECPAKGGLVAGGHKSPVSDYRVFFPGTVTDRCMRQWLQQENPQRGWMRANVVSIMDTEEQTAKDTGDGVVRWKHTKDRDEVREKCLEAVDQLESDLWTQLHLWQPPAYDWDPAPRFEIPCQVPHPSGGKARILLVGEIDLLIRTPTGVQVWDLKTTRDNSYWRKTLGQLVFYEIAVWCMTKEWPERSGLLQPLCDETTPSWQFTQDNRVQMLQRIYATTSDIWAGRLDPRPLQSRCTPCEVRHACPLKGKIRGRVAMSLPVVGA